MSNGPMEVISPFVLRAIACDMEEMQSPQAWADRCRAAAAEIEKLRAALRLLVSSTYSHLDGRDLLGELHPRNTLDIKRRVDGVETWFEGDWLTDLMDARNIARAALGEKE